jgi:hypothetical protein
LELLVGVVAGSVIARFAEPAVFQIASVPFLRSRSTSSAASRGAHVG